MKKIYEYIKRDVIEGKIPVGEKLPSTRLFGKAFVGKQKYRRNGI